LRLRIRVPGAGDASAGQLPGWELDVTCPR